MKHLNEENVVELTASALPVKTWNWLHVNDTRIKLPVELDHKYQEYLNIDTLPDGVLVMQEAMQADQSNNVQIQGAIGNEYDQWILNQEVDQYTFIINKTLIEDPIRIHMHMKDGLKKAVILNFNVKAGCSADVIIECDSADKGTGMLGVSALCNLEDAAHLSIHQVQMMGQGYQYISDIGANQDTDSKLDVVRVNLGAKNSYLGLKTSLNGKNAAFMSRLAYLSRDTQHMDVNDIVLHKGKKTLSDLNSEGVLLDQAEKNYKGTIDLQHGCAGAKGQELETVLLLSDDVINKTVPLILCGEEDVEGNHGASIGKIDEDTLLYMESRGIPQDQARLLIVSGRLDQIINKIPDAAIAERASTFIKEVF